MADRIYNAQIEYPFIYHSDPTEVDGILDCLLYLSPDDTLVTPASVPSDIDDVGAWLHTTSIDVVLSDTYYVYQFYVQVPIDPDVYPMDDEFPTTTPRYAERTFRVLVNGGTTIVTARAEEDERSALTVNVEQAAVVGATLNDNLVEPGCIVPCTRKVSQINVYNEFRAHDPATRSDLPPDFLDEEVTPGQVLVFDDGYNCAVSYNEITQTLRFTGGLGFGLGRPDSNPWDDTDENFDDGVRDVNGVNTQGVVEIEAGGGVILDASVEGELRILVRNQGELQCPPE